MLDEAQSGALFSNLARDAGARRRRLCARHEFRLGDRLCHGPQQARRPARSIRGSSSLLNLPALVVIVLAYIWAGLTEVGGDRRRRAQQVAQRHRRRCARARARSIRSSTTWRRSFRLSRARAAAPHRRCRSSRPISRRRRARASRWSGRSCWSSNCSAAPTASASRSTWPSSCSTCACCLLMRFPSSRSCSASKLFWCSLLNDTSRAGGAALLDVADRV